MDDNRYVAPDFEVIDGDQYRLPDIGEAPWLIVTHENSRRTSEKQTFFTMSSLSPENKSYIKKIVQLQDKFILGSSLGWLILHERDNPNMYSLWNLVTLQSITLPELLDDELGDEQPTCALTLAPYDSDDPTTCVLLLFFEGLVFFCRPLAGEDCVWVKQSLKHGDKSVKIRDVATLNGDIYSYITCKMDNDYHHDMLVRIKIADDNSNLVIFEPSLLELPHCKIKFTVHIISFRYLVEVCGVLYFVYVPIMGPSHSVDNFDILTAIVWRLDLSQMEWIPVKSLGDRALLLCGSGSSWCWAVNSIDNLTGNLIEKDCIYFAGPWSPTIHAYHLRDNRYTFWSLHPEFRWSFDDLIWFVPPDHSRLLSSTYEEKIDNHDEEKKEVILSMELSKTILSRLPPEILISIANYVPIFIAYMNLRAACKTISPAAKGQVDCSIPLLLSLKNNKELYELWSDCEAISGSIKMPHSPTYLSKIEFCKDGWLLVRLDGNSLRYLNPFTREKGEYPPNDKLSVTDTSYAFSTCPNSSDCLTIGISWNPHETYISCFRAATGKWDVYRYYEGLDTGFLANSCSNPMYLDGAFYFTDEKGYLGVFKLIEDEPSWMVYPSPLTVEAAESLNYSYLVELDGDVICVFFQQVGSLVQLFKFDILQETWFELDNLGDYALFLSPASSFSVSEKDTTKRNRIYLSKLIDDEIVYYSLDKGKYFCLGNNNVCKDNFYGMSTQASSCWI